VFALFNEMIYLKNYKSLISEKSEIFSMVFRLKSDLTFFLIELFEEFCRYFGYNPKKSLYLQNLLITSGFKISKAYLLSVNSL